ncbi:hypothetical protein BH20ACT3_BH20ACT3_18600 [soil metagenome]
MVELLVGDEVKISMPRGKNLRGVPGVHLMFTTSPEAKFDGGTGVVTEINPRGPQGIPLFLVDFRNHDNPWIPWQAQWFRENWLTPVEQRPEVHEEPERAAAAPPDPSVTSS